VASRRWPTIWSNCSTILGIDRLPVTGGSGGGPHVLAVAARHPHRVSAATWSSARRRSPTRTSRC
jgi:homoserine acetyltransferase